MSTILITGASRGIGLAAAIVLARAGHTVHATMRNPASAPILVRIAREELLKIIISPMDVNSDASVSENIRSIEETYGPIDVLVNNAGIEGHGSIEETPLSDFRAVMETNYFGCIRCIQAVMPGMRKRRNGLIINISSVAGRIASPPLGPYNATKFALEALSESLAAEAGMFNIRVAIIEPGIIETDMARSITHTPPDQIYPHVKRFSGLFSAALEHHVSATLIGEKIQEIITSGTRQLRHPVGPDSIPFLQWRASMTDEEWVALNGVDEDTWYNTMQSSFGMDLRPKEDAALLHASL